MKRTFYAGSSTFNCTCCGRLTRDTSGDGLEMCSHCEELAYLENEVNDGHTSEAEGMARAARIIADMRSKHGDAFADKAAACSSFA